MRLDLDGLLEWRGADLAKIATRQKERCGSGPWRCGSAVQNLEYSADLCLLVEILARWSGGELGGYNGIVGVVGLDWIGLGWIRLVIHVFWGGGAGLTRGIRHAYDLPHPVKLVSPSTTPAPCPRPCPVRIDVRRSDESKNLKVGRSFFGSEFLLSTRSGDNAGQFACGDAGACRRGIGVIISRSQVSEAARQHLWTAARSAAPAHDADFLHQRRIPPPPPSPSTWTSPSPSHIPFFSTSSPPRKPPTSSDTPLPPALSQRRCPTTVLPPPPSSPFPTPSLSPPDANPVRCGVQSRLRSAVCRLVTGSIDIFRVAALGG